MPTRRTTHYSIDVYFMGNKLLSVDPTGGAWVEIFFNRVKKLINSVTRVFKVYGGGLDGGA